MGFEISSVWHNDEVLFDKRESISKRTNDESYEVYEVNSYFSESANNWFSRAEQSRPELNACLLKSDRNH